MLKLFGTLLSSLGNIYQSVRRKVGVKACNSLLFMLTTLMKKTKLYYTKDELNVLAKESETLTSKIDV